MDSMALVAILLVAGQLCTVNADASSSISIFAPSFTPLYPDSRVKNFMYSLTDSPKNWHTGMPTVLLHLNVHTDYIMDASVLHAVAEDTTLKLLRNCDATQPGIGNAVLEKPVKNSEHPAEVICSSPYRLVMYGLKGVIRDSTDKHTKDLYLTKKIRIENNPSVPLKDVFTHFIRLELHFLGNHWGLSSSALYIRNWDSVFELNKPGSISGSMSALWFLSDDALSMMKESRSGIQKGAGKTQFLNVLIVRAIEKASEFVQTSISIGAILLFNAVSCADIRPENSIAFMTDSYAEHELYIDTVKVMRLDPVTGVLTYSRYGLTDLSKKVDAESKRTSGLSCSGSGSCSKLHICVRLQYTPLGGTLSYSRTEVSTTREISDSSSHFGLTGSPESSCHELGVSPKYIKVFARAAVSYIICPIICDRITENFRFFKGGVELKPESGKKFTRVGGFEIHESGVMLRATESASHFDSGEYSCTAGGKTMKLEIDVYGLPTFHIPDTPFSRGFLPRRLYAVEGDGFKVNCSVFHSGFRTVDVLVSFQVMKRNSLIGGKISWVRQSFSQFNDHFKRFTLKGSVVADKRREFTTVTYSIDNVPAINAGVPFNHKLTCSAEATPQELKKFVIPDYRTQSSADVICVNRLRNGDIHRKMAGCCKTNCDGYSGSYCEVEYKLSPEVMGNLAKAGVTVLGAFRVRDSNVPGYARGMVKFLPSTGALQWKGTKGIKDMTDEEKFDFASLVPVFLFFIPDEDGVWPKVTYTRKDTTTFIGAMICRVHGLCIYTTDNDYELTTEMTFGETFGLPVTVPDSHRFMRNPVPLVVDGMPPIPRKPKTTVIPDLPPALPHRITGGTEISKALEALKGAKESKISTVGVRPYVELVLGCSVFLALLWT